MNIKRERGSCDPSEAGINFMIRFWSLTAVQMHPKAQFSGGGRNPPG